MIKRQGDSEYTIHAAPTLSNTALQAYHRAIYANTSGNVVIDDQNDNTLTYAVTAGQLLHFSAKRIRTTTTATVYLLT